MYTIVFYVLLLQAGITMRNKTNYGHEMLMEDNVFNGLSTICLKRLDNTRM